MPSPLAISKAYEHVTASSLAPLRTTPERSLLGEGLPEHLETHQDARIDIRGLEVPVGDSKSRSGNREPEVPINTTLRGFPSSSCRSGST